MGNSRDKAGAVDLPDVNRWLKNGGEPVEFATTGAWPRRKFILEHMLAATSEGKTFTSGDVNRWLKACGYEAYFRADRKEMQKRGPLVATGLYADGSRRWAYNGQELGLRASESTRVKSKTTADVQRLDDPARTRRAARDLLKWVMGPAYARDTWRVDVVGLALLVKARDAGLAMHYTGGMVLAEGLEPISDDAGPGSARFISLPGFAPTPAKEPPDWARSSPADKAA